MNSIFHIFRNCLFTTFALTFFVFSDSSANERQPNIVLIFADDVGREVLECYGGESYETPNLNRLAANGMQFENFHAAPVCHSSRIMLMTGNYPSRYRNPKWGTYPKQAEKTSIAQTLKSAGYKTAIAGKWQISMLKDDPTHPHRLGFDEYSLFGWHEGPRFWDPLIWENGKLRKEAKGKYGPEEYVQFLRKFMTKNKNRPFFAMYSMALCHAVSDDFLPRPPHGPKGRYMTYGEMVADMDFRVGQIVATIDEIGIANDTLILFTTDNGTTRTNFIRHEGKKLINDRQTISRFKGRDIIGAKTKFTDWGIRVPTIAAWPNKIKKRQINDTLGDLTDLLPTFADLAGNATLPKTLDGKSFANVLTGKSKKGPRAWACVQNGRISCVKDLRWKLLSNGQLFDLKNDPDEKKAIVAGKDTSTSKEARGRLQKIQDQISKPIIP